MRNAYLPRRFLNQLCRLGTLPFRFENVHVVEISRDNSRKFRSSYSRSSSAKNCREFLEENSSSPRATASEQCLSCKQKGETSFRAALNRFKFKRRDTNSSLLNFFRGTCYARVILVQSSFYLVARFFHPTFGGENNRLRSFIILCIHLTH